LSRGLSEHAIQSLDGLSSSWFINWVLRGSIHDPAMGGSDHHPNWRIFTSMEWYLTGRQVAHAGDALNTYCQLILADILRADHSAWHLVEKRLRRNTRDTREDLIERLDDCRCFDKAVRAAIRDDIGAYWSPESDLIIEMRNNIVHQGGIDTAGDVLREIQKLETNGGTVIYPTDLPRDVIPVAVAADNRVQIDAATGFWASRHIENHIHLMDQNLTYRFGVKTHRWRPKNTGYSLSADSKALPSPPGTPLPTTSPTFNVPEPAPELSPLPPYDPMANPKEAACAQTWFRLHSEIHEFVKSYCEEAGVHIRSQNSGRCGTMRSHTLEGHDMRLDYGLTRLDSDHSSKEQLGVRLRQKNFDPFVTIWATNSQMQDFELSEVSEKIKEFLRGCIDKTLTK
jgi:hypothetical protein